MIEQVVDDYSEEGWLESGGWVDPDEPMSEDEEEERAVLEIIALADSIAWQMAKDGGEAGVSLETWELAIYIAERELAEEIAYA